MIVPVSPSLTSGGKWSNEVKFVVPQEVVPQILEWVRGQMSPDPHGQVDLDGAYLVRTLYLDTANQDVLKKSKGYRVNKYRIRRYGCDSGLHLECKRKIKDRVSKDRVTVSGLALLHLVEESKGGDKSFEPTSFWDAVSYRKLAPATLVEYKRYAFFGIDSGNTVRLTIDVDIVTQRHDEWSVPSIDDPTEVSQDAVIEIKFPSLLPNMFREFLLRFGLTPVGFSKYRSAMLTGAAPDSIEDKEGGCSSS